MIVKCPADPAAAGHFSCRRGKVFVNSSEKKRPVLPYPPIFVKQGKNGAAFVDILCV